MANYNLHQTQGDTYIQNFAFTDSNWDPINLAWAVIKMSIKQNISDTLVLVQATLTHTSDPLWTAQAKFTSTQMNLALGNYFYELEFTDTLLTVTTLLKWMFTVTFDVT